VGQVRLLKAQSVRRLTARPVESEYLERKSTSSNSNKVYSQTKEKTLASAKVLPTFK
jgi:hypothetical protein